KPSRSLRQCCRTACKWTCGFHGSQKLAEVNRDFRFGLPSAVPTRDYTPEPQSSRTSGARFGKFFCACVLNNLHPFWPIHESGFPYRVRYFEVVKQPGALPSDPGSRKRGILGHLHANSSADGPLLLG